VYRQRRRARCTPQPRGGCRCRARAEGGGMNNLLQYFPNLRQISEKSTEHEGPCPLCKGGEDRFCLWTDGGIENTGRFFCRQCERSGNAVTLLQEALGMSEAAARVAA